MEHKSNPKKILCRLQTNWEYVWKKIGTVSVKVMLCSALFFCAACGRSRRHKKNLRRNHTKWMKSLIHWAEQPVRQTLSHRLPVTLIQCAGTSERLLIRSIKTNGAGHSAKTTAAQRQRLTVQRQPGTWEKKNCLVWIKNRFTPFLHLLTCLTGCGD